MKKDTIIDYLTKHLLASKSNSLNDESSLQKDNTNEANRNNTSHDKIRTQGNDGNNSKRKGVAMEIQCLMVLMNVVYQNTKT